MLCACRTESLWLRLVVLALAVLLTFVGWVAGGEPWRKPLLPAEASWAEQVGLVDVNGSIDLGTDRAQVRHVLRRGAILVAFGTEKDVDEHLSFVEALATQACLGMAGPLRDELLPLRDRLQAALSRELAMDPERTREHLSDGMLLDVVARAAEGPGSLRVKEVTVEVGFASYRHWQRRITEKPITQRGVIRWQPIERRVALPDTYQLYVRLLRAERAHSLGR